MTVANLEITSGVIRVFRRETAAFGEPFDLAFAFSADEGRVTLKALSNAYPARSDFAAVADCLRAAGFHTMRWNRHREGGDPTREYDL